MDRYDSIEYPKLPISGNWNLIFKNQMQLLLFTISFVL